jgi:soluble P-type ATPase
VEKGAGDTVLAATLLLTGRIEVRVEQAGSATLTAQIGAVLNDITDYRERQELRCDETADRLVLPTLTAGALTLASLGWMSAVTVMGANFTETLRVAYPLGALSYLNLAAQEGILIKDGRALERLSQVDTVIFDKTGTLTLDQPHVAALHPCLPFSGEQLLTYAAAAEFRQNHPLARAILTAAEQRQLPLPSIDEAAYVVGFGIKVRLQPSVGPSAPTEDQQPEAADTGLLVRVGSARFMAQEGLVLPAALVTLQQRCHEQGHSLVYVAVADQLAGALELHATVRPEVQTIVQELRQRGLQLYIISGDQPQPTQHLAATLGVDNYFAEVLPAEKARYVEQLQREGRTVCFIGDGINDAVALKQADVSMSVRGATTVATNIAQIIFMDQSFHQLAHLFELGYQLDANLKRSLAAMLVPSGINLVGALFFRFSIRSAIVLFNASLLAGVMNALAPLLTRTGQASTNAVPSPWAAGAAGIPTFPRFKRLTVADRAEVEKFTQQFPPYSQLTFPSLLAYDIANDTEICWLHGNLVVRLLDFTTRRHFYSFLGTTQVRKTIEQLLLRAEQEGIIDELLLVPEAALRPDWEELQQYFTISADRACFDYILAADMLCQLASNPVHPKAKELRKFQRAYPTAVATEIDLKQPAIQADVQRLFSTWADKRQKTADETAVETTALTRLLQFADQLTLVTVGVYLDGQLIAFTINEIVQAGYYIGHFGKADPAYRGLSLYAECETAKLMHQAGCLYLNYEEDLGHSGLRTYKEALQPIGFLRKYTVRTKQGFTQAHHGMKAIAD